MISIEKLTSKGFSISQINQIKLLDEICEKYQSELKEERQGSLIDSVDIHIPVESLKKLRRIMENESASCYLKKYNYEYLKAIYEIPDEVFDIVNGWKSEEISILDSFEFIVRNPKTFKKVFDEEKLDESQKKMLGKLKYSIGEEYIDDIIKIGIKRTDKLEKIVKYMEKGEFIPFVLDEDYNSHQIDAYFEILEDCGNIDERLKDAAYQAEDLMVAAHFIKNEKWLDFEIFKRYQGDLIHEIYDCIRQGVIVGGPEDLFNTYYDNKCLSYETISFFVECDDKNDVEITSKLFESVIDDDMDEYDIEDNLRQAGALIDGGYTIDTIKKFINSDTTYEYRQAILEKTFENGLKDEILLDLCNGNFTYEQIDAICDMFKFYEVNVCKYVEIDFDEEQIKFIAKSLASGKDVSSIIKNGFSLEEMRMTDYLKGKGLEYDGSQEMKDEFIKLKNEDYRVFLEILDNNSDFRSSVNANSAIIIDCLLKYNESHSKNPANIDAIVNTPSLHYKVIDTFFEDLTKYDINLIYSERYDSDEVRQEIREYIDKGTDVKEITEKARSASELLYLLKNSKKLEKGKNLDDLIGDYKKETERFITAVTRWAKREGFEK